MTSLSQTFPQLPAKGLPASPYYLANYGMPHFSHTSLISSLTNPFIPSDILNLLKDELNNEKLSALRTPQLYDTSSVNSFVSSLDYSKKYEQASSTQVTSSTSDSETPSKPRNVIVRNEHVKKKKELIKDDAYWERRRKNNDAAKRSRDSRRQKEDEVAIRAAVLEQENIQLRLEVERLKAETERLRMLMITPAILSSTTQMSVNSNAEALLNATVIQQPETTSASFISSSTSSSSLLSSSSSSLSSSSSPTSSFLSQHC